MEVNADPLKRSPRTATLPDVTVNSAEPRAPAIAASPGRFLNTASVLLFASNGTVALPRALPELSRTVMETNVGTLLGLTIATAVMYFNHNRAGLSICPAPGRMLQTRHGRHANHNPQVHRL